MKATAQTLLVFSIVFTCAVSAVHADPGNANIDMPGFLRVAKEAASHRESHRISEDEFVRLGRESGTVILDARSAAKFALLHVQGAINLNFSDLGIDSLQKSLPDKNQRILIYCNNNFAGSPVAFASKTPSASLNISTYITLYNYGYRNVYELAPFVNVRTTKLTLIGTDPQARTTSTPSAHPDLPPSRSNLQP